MGAPRRPPLLSARRLKKAPVMSWSARRLKKAPLEKGPPEGRGGGGGGGVFN